MHSTIHRTSKPELSFLSVPDSDPNCVATSLRGNGNKSTRPLKMYFTWGPEDIITTAQQLCVRLYTIFRSMGTRDRRWRAGKTERGRDGGRVDRGRDDMVLPDTDITPVRWVVLP